MPSAAALHSTESLFDYNSRTDRVCFYGNNFDRILSTSTLRQTTVFAVSCFPDIFAIFASAADEVKKSVFLRRHIFAQTQAQTSPASGDINATQRRGRPNVGLYTRCPLGCNGTQRKFSSLVMLDNARYRCVRLHCLTSQSVYGQKSTGGKATKLVFQ